MEFSFPRLLPLIIALGALIVGIRYYKFPESAIQSAKHATEAVVQSGEAAVHAGKIAVEKIPSDFKDTVEQLRETAARVLSVISGKVEKKIEAESEKGISETSDQPATHTAQLEAVLDLLRSVEPLAHDFAAGAELTAQGALIQVFDIFSKFPGSAKDVLEQVVQTGGESIHSIRELTTEEAKRIAELYDGIISAAGRVLSAALQNNEEAQGGLLKDRPEALGILGQQIQALAQEIIKCEAETCSEEKQQLISDKMRGVLRVGSALARRPSGIFAQDEEFRKSLDELEAIKDGGFGWVKERAAKLRAWVTGGTKDGTRDLAR